VDSGGGRRNYYLNMQTGGERPIEKISELIPKIVIGWNIGSISNKLRKGTSNSFIPFT
jgi:hypothetical protein